MESASIPLHNAISESSIIVSNDNIVTSSKLNDVWTREVGPKLSARDLLSLSGVSKWGFTIAHLISRHLGFASIKVPQQYQRQPQEQQHELLMTCTRILSLWPQMRIDAEFKNLNLQSNVCLPRLGPLAFTSLTIWNPQTHTLDFVNPCRLETFVFADNQQKLQSNARLQQSLHHILVSAPSLTTLQLTCPGALDSDVAWLANDLSCLPLLSHLDLRGNHLGTERITQLFAGLKKTSSLTNLNLFDNSMMAEGLAAVAMCLEHNASLKYLCLGYNGLGPEGAQVLAPALSNLRELILLDLVANKIGSEGAMYLLSPLTMLPNLCTVNLSLNQIASDVQTNFRTQLPQVKELWAGF